MPTGFVARVGKERLRSWVTYGGMVGSKGYAGDQEKGCTGRVRERSEGVRHQVRRVRDAVPPVIPQALK